MARRTKKWDTRIEEIIATINGNDFKYEEYRDQLLVRIDQKLRTLTDQTKKNLSNSLHLNKQKLTELSF